MHSAAASAPAAAGAEHANRKWCWRFLPAEAVRAPFNAAYAALRPIHSTPIRQRDGCRDCGRRSKPEQIIAAVVAPETEHTVMAVNKPTGDSARKGAVRKRSQLATKTMGKKTWTKRDKTSGEFMDQKKAPAKNKFKGVRRER
jgi:hypothetical protein